MKKKLSIIILSMIILPVVALLGCKEVKKFEITTFYSSSVYGTVNGRGTYNEGSTVVLSATAKEGGYFIGWVFNNQTLLTDDSTYKIQQTQTGEITTSSQLSFKMSEKTQGNYSPVFDRIEDQQNSTMMYVKLETIRIAKKETYQSAPDGNNQSENLADFATIALSVSHGQTSNSLVDVVNLTEETLKDNQNFKLEDINQVLKLSSDKPSHIRVQLTAKIGSQSLSRDLRADLNFQTDTLIDSNYEITYAKSTGIYKIVFDLGDYCFVLEYKNLT